MFSWTVSSAIVLNTFCLALDKHPADQNLENLLANLNMVFFAIFFIEMIIKFIGLGFKSYFKDHFNTFDFIIVIVSTVDIAIA